MSIALLASVLVGALALALFSAVGYPALLRLRARGRRSPVDGVLAASDAAGAPSPAAVTAIVATRDAPAVILERVRDLRAGDFPGEQLDVVVAVDAASPYAPEDYERALRGAARIVIGDPAGGKAAALNAGARAAIGDVLLFADSAQQFAPTVIRDLVTSVSADRVGAVTGVIAPAADDPLLDRYWQHELELRRLQSRIHSIICVSGAVYVMRRALWRPMPEGLICDDLFATTQVVMQGWRVVICERAIATDPREFTREQHFRRKVRTLTGLVQLCVWTPQILLPWRNAIWLDLVSHKLIRILLPYIALTAAVAAGCLALRVGGATIVWALSAFALLALMVVVVRPQIARQVAWAVRLSTAPVLALSNALRGRWRVW